MIGRLGKIGLHQGQGQNDETEIYLVFSAA
jgi:hypothetical protein